MSTFTAKTIHGLGRGKAEFVPTINLELRDIPKDLEEGIYVCRAGLNEADKPAVMHYGPRPAVQATRSCEVHLLDEELTQRPETVTVRIVQRLRDVSDFASPADLKDQIQADIRQARAILSAHADQV